MVVSLLLDYDQAPMRPVMLFKLQTKYMQKCAPKQAGNGESSKALALGQLREKPLELSLH